MNVNQLMFIVMVTLILLSISFLVSDGDAGIDDNACACVVAMLINRTPKVLLTSY